ncbi:unnamed protein product [Victoria cruziana]
MRRWKEEPPAIRVYTVCDESRYLVVRNVPALRCIDELVKLFGSYGEISEYKVLDEEVREQFTEVCCIKFLHVGNARFAKRKLDDYVFYGNRLQVSYAPQHETLSDTKEKLEIRRKEVLSRLHCGSLLLGATTIQNPKLHTRIF